MPRRKPQETPATASSSGAASSVQEHNQSDAQAAVEAALSNSPEAARHADWATMLLRDKLDFIVNEKVKAMESIINGIFARSTNRAFKYDEKNKDAKATLRRLKESQVKNAVGLVHSFPVKRYGEMFS